MANHNHDPKKMCYICVNDMKDDKYDERFPCDYEARIQQDFPECSNCEYKKQQGQTTLLCSRSSDKHMAAITKPPPTFKFGSGRGGPFNYQSQQSLPQWPQPAPASTVTNNYYPGYRSSSRDAKRHRGDTGRSRSRSRSRSRYRERREERSRSRSRQPLRRNDRYESRYSRSRYSPDRLGRYESRKSTRRVDRSPSVYSSRREERWESRRPSRRAVRSPSRDSDFYDERRRSRSPPRGRSGHRGSSRYDDHPRSSRDQVLDITLQRLAKTEEQLRRTARGFERAERFLEDTFHSSMKAAGEGTKFGRRSAGTKRKRESDDGGEQSQASSDPLMTLHSSLQASRKSQGRCFTCGEAGHTQWQCPGKKTKKQEPKKQEPSEGAANESSSKRRRRNNRPRKRKNKQRKKSKKPCTNWSTEGVCKNGRWCRWFHEGQDDPDNLPLWGHGQGEWGWDRPEPKALEDVNDEEHDDDDDRKYLRPSRSPCLGRSFNDEFVDEDEDADADDDGDQVEYDRNSLGGLPFIPLKPDVLDDQKR